MEVLNLIDWPSRGVPQGSIARPLLLRPFMLPLGSILQNTIVGYHSYSDERQPSKPMTRLYLVPERKNSFCSTHKKKMECLSSSTMQLMKISQKGRFNSKMIPLAQRKRKCSYVRLSVRTYNPNVLYVVSKVLFLSSGTNTTINCHHLCPASSSPCTPPNQNK